jgi:hypothetical protein
MQIAIFRLFSLNALVTILFFLLPVVGETINKMTMLDQAYSMPLILAFACWYWPAKFLTNVLLFPSIKRTICTTNSASNSKVGTDAINQIMTVHRVAQILAKKDRRVYGNSSF